MRFRCSSFAVFFLAKYSMRILFTLFEMFLAPDVSRRNNRDFLKDKMRAGLHIRFLKT
jgi:hypothetical protein